MSIFLSFMFIFFIGSILGWVLELLFRRIYNGSWVNPGFLIGPYVPIYGFGICTITFLHIFLSNYDLNIFLTAIIMGIILTVIELVTGLIFITYGKIKLWDYSNEWGNYKGIICPLFSLFWCICALIYDYFIAERILSGLSWFSENLSFSFVLGVFFGTIIIDFLYSTKIFKKIRKFAKQNQMEVKYEEFKTHIKDLQKERKEKYSFTFPFKQTKSLKDYLDDYNEHKKKSN